MRIIIACLIFLSVSCSRSGSNAEARTDAATDAPVVSVAKAVRKDLSRDLTLTAEFRPYQEVDVMAKVAGYIKQIRVDVGDRVKEGQLLAVLEIPEMADDEARAKAAVERSQSEVARANDQLRGAQSAYNIAHLSYTRLKTVSDQKPGLVAQQEIDDAQSKELVADAQVASARSALAAAQQQVQVNTAELQRVKTMFEYTRVTAPFTGVVTKRYADTGSMIQAGTASNTQAMPVVRLSQNGLLRLILPVPESAVSTVHIGQEVEVRVSALKRSFSGKVARFDDKVAMATRTMNTEVDVPNPTLTLIPGMYAEVTLTLDRRQGVVAVPVAAVDNGQVMIVTPANRVEPRKVELGLETADSIEVRSGLAEGDSVVMSSRSGLQAGQEVRPKVRD